MYGSEEQSHNALQRRLMNNLAIRPATIFLLASVSAFFGKYLRTPLSGAPRRLAAAGVSVAYVFVRTLPEMSDAQGRFHAGNCWPRIAILGTPRLLGCPDRALVLLWFD